MLKIGSVYQYENNLWYVESKRKYRRILYRLRRVLADGSLAEVFETNFTRGEFHIVEKARAYIKIDIPKSVRRQMMYMNLVRETKKLLMEYVTPEKRQQHKNYTWQLAQHSIASIGHYDSKRKKVIDLRIFAKDIGLKSGAKLYNLIARYYKESCPEAKYTHEIPSLSDSALISSYEQMTNTWKYIHGYSKRLDGYLERDLRGYIDELKERNINLAIREDKYLQPDC
jgi:hypothetical protein